MSDAVVVVDIVQDFVYEKLKTDRTYSAFYDTGLDLMLRQRGVGTVIVAGLRLDQREYGICYYSCQEAKGRE